MKTLFFFALRNILRQKSRAILLGTAMALGTCFLVISGSFVTGISQTLFDRVMVYVAGHASVIVGDRGYQYRPALRGEANLRERLAKLPHVKRVQETIGIMCRMVGSKKSDNGILIGTDLSQKMSAKELAESRDNFPMVAGSFLDLARPELDVPAILSRSKAEYLGVKVGDPLAVRFQDSRGRNQVSHLVLVGIFEPSNSFMDAPLFVSMDRLKTLMDMDSTDMPYLYFTLEDPQKNAIPIADSIRRILAPRLAALPARIATGAAFQNGFAAGVKTDSVSRARVDAQLKPALAWKKGRIVLPADMAAALKVVAGDTVRVSSGFSHAGDTVLDRAEVAGTWVPPKGAEGLALWDEDAFQGERSFRSHLSGDTGIPQVQAASRILDTLLSPEWTLLPRAPTTDDVRDQMRKVGARSWKSPVVMVRTMYETGDMILKLASALNKVTLVVVLVLLLVVLTGVVNSLRMTVRERTREIGTLRSLGMQASQVRVLFLMETGLLAFFSAAAGTLAAGVVMFGLSRISFSILGNPLSILMVRGHLVFVPGILSTVGQIALVVGMALIAAWGPSGTAARLNPADALRHHE
jgi:ABC-type lipoprotein release transport system permease subunit